MSYHLIDIPKGVYGEFSKIEEEFLELKDALTQENPIMALCELSDLIGAIEAYATKYNVTLDDLLRMKGATTRAFQSGARTAR
jgi:hypothetical protein